MIDIRPVETGDRESWEPLFLGYGDFYKVSMDDRIVSAVWAWLLDPAHEMEGLVAEMDGKLVGLAHFRRMPSPLQGTDVGFLDDLFVLTEARGHDIGGLLISRIVEIARQRGWPKIRWLTADDNYRARSLYDRVGRKTDRNLYEIVIGPA
jgi:GNAT superfamily N-acetyltransferase